MVPDRLKEAKRHGATDAFNPQDDPVSKIKELTGGRGADVCLEVVGAAPALYTAVEVVRNFGVISSCGIHTQPVTFKGLDLYNKNLRFQFGRCPVRAVFEVSCPISSHFNAFSDHLSVIPQPALKMVGDNVDVFKTFVQHAVSIDEAVEYYDLFDKRKIGKTVFKF